MGPATLKAHLTGATGFGPSVDAAEAQVLELDRQQRYKEAPVPVRIPNWHWLSLPGHMDIINCGITPASWPLPMISV